jgi:hypothetical protein
MGRRIRTLALAVATFAAIPALACGLEDPSSIAVRRGVLQLAFPNALHVGTAVWQAQLAGVLPRDALVQRADLSPEARGALRLVKASAMLGRLAARMNGVSGPPPHPALAVVLIGPVMWSRFDGGDGPVRTQVHVAGPEPGDVVAVTDVAVIEAIAEGTLDFAGAAEQGLLRLYGAPDDVAATRAWLLAATRG